MPGLLRGQTAADLRLSSWSRALAFAPDGKTLALADGKNVRIWDAESGKEAPLLEGHRFTVWEPAFVNGVGTVTFGTADPRAAQSHPYYTDGQGAVIDLASTTSLYNTAPGWTFQFVAQRGSS